MQAMLKSHLHGEFSKRDNGRQSQFEGMACELLDWNITSDVCRTLRMWKENNRLFLI